MFSACLVNVQPGRFLEDLPPSPTSGVTAADPACSTWNEYVFRRSGYVADANVQIAVGLFEYVDTPKGLLAAKAPQVRCFEGFHLNLTVTVVLLLPRTQLLRATTSTGTPVDQVPSVGPPTASSSMI